MKTIELFCGTKSFSKEAEKRGWPTFTVDNNPQHEPKYCSDIMDTYLPQGVIDILWASPPCTSFSVSSIGKHWNKDHTPKTEQAELGLKILERTILLINQCEPKYWFIENPRGKMRKVIDKLFARYGITDYVRRTVTYCQYGDTRMKPTDIWTNCMQWEPKPICKNGDPCHEAAPRGSKTGTQGLKNKIVKGVIPPDLINEILDACKE